MGFSAKIRGGFLGFWDFCSLGAIRGSFPRGFPAGIEFRGGFWHIFVGFSAGIRGMFLGFFGFWGFWPAGALRGSFPRGLPAAPPLAVPYVA